MEKQTAALLAPIEIRFRLLEFLGFSLPLPVL